MKRTHSRCSWLACRAFLVAMLAGFCVAGCEKDNGGSGGGSTGGGGGDVTFAQYEAVSAHMSYNDVHGIMGRKQNLSTSSQTLEGVTTGYSWTSPNNEVITVDIVDPPFQIGNVSYYGVWMKSCAIYDDNHTLVIRNQSLY